MGNTLIKYDYGSAEVVFQKVLFSLGISRSLEYMKKAEKAQRSPRKSIQRNLRFTVAFQE